MDPNQHNRPFDAHVRATACESCCDANAVPPCAKGWLSAKLAVPAPTPMILPAWEKKAA